MKPKHIYLAGAVDKAPDHGAGWRDEIEPFLVREINSAVFNPCRQEDKLRAELSKVDTATPEGRLKRFGLIKQLIDADLDVLSVTDAVVCYWDKWCKGGGGTAGEVTLAYRSGIPVYLVLGMPEDECSGWVLGAATEIFSSFDELKDFLLKL
jgi:hypothetical protein